MHELLRQRKYMMNQHATMECLLALHDQGILNALPTTGEGATVDDLAAAHGCVPRILGALLDYVALTTPLVMRRGDRYLAQPETRGRILGFVLDMATAYAPVFRSLPALLSGAQEYERDVRRDGEALGRASGFATRNTIPVITRRFDAYGVAHAIDLGCGGGEIVAALCADPARRATGVDIDAASAAAACARLDGLGLGDRTRIVVADLADPEALEAPTKGERTGICSVGVVHELLRGGDAALVEVLAAWRKRFPDAVFCIAEFDAATFDEMAEGDEETLLAASYYQLIHPLSGQGDPQPMARWLDLFAQAGFTVAHVDRVPVRFVVYTLV